MTKRLEIAARWAPAILVPLGVIVAWLAGPVIFEAWVSAPNSVFEHLVGLVLITAIITAVYALTRREAREHPGLRVWLAAYVVGLVYFAGEDLNWGQHIFGWQPSEFFLENNKEAETNLHNMSPWFNQKPRLLVSAWVLIAGVLVPLGWSWPKRAMSRFAPAVLWPGRETIWLALTASIIPAIEWLLLAVLGPDLGGVPIRFSEIQEFFFAWFMLLYVVDLSGRLRRTEAGRVHQNALRAPAE